MARPKLSPPPLGENFANATSAKAFLAHVSEKSRGGLHPSASGSCVDSTLASASWRAGDGLGPPKGKAYSYIESTGSGWRAPPKGKDSGRSRVATAYGVSHSLRLEANLNSIQRQAGLKGFEGVQGLPPGGWRRSSELEQKLRAAEEVTAASRVQVALLREENRRKGNRIRQLEDLLAEMEKDYCTVKVSSCA